MHLIHDKDSISNLGRDMNFSKKSSEKPVRYQPPTTLPNVFQLYKRFT